MVVRRGFCELGFAKVDVDRQQRRGFPEVVYCPGKSKEHIRKICKTLLAHKQTLLLTRLEKKYFTYLKRTFTHLRYNALARIGYSMARAPQRKGHVLVISAGTADLPVAEEAAVTLEVMGNCVQRLYDVGVAGVHRVMSHQDAIQQAKVIVVVAGMEGALASLISGLARCPVVAVPTSCGYGASFQGLSALLTMLNSCSPGVAVMNIDNGFGAGYFASLVNK
ncbi:MAG: nickel pincer cofactor biosynthesis protein LarB [Candidatus Omnitrophica bacterium]|nr:nickel pincer cofactor biosynthesis protein LarB [Candidatus Omnitrophota bacterium]